MAAQKSKKTETSNSHSERPRAAIVVHPRAARMQRLGTYHLQTPGQHVVTAHDLAQATEQAHKVMEQERGVVEETPAEVVETPAEQPASNMVDSIQGDALAQEESKSEQRRKAEMKKAKPADKPKKK